jgi:hypothetical protein
MRAAVMSLVVGLLSGCGGSDVPAIDASSEELRCSEQPKIDAATGIATSIGCGFVQQSYNVTNNGTVIDAAGVPLSDGRGATVATITHACGRWVIGQDTQDQTVIIAIDTGEVRSHGTLHTGQETSALGSNLELPLTY